MQRRKFSREFKLEAVRLVKERGVAVARRRGISTSMRMCCANGCGICRPTRTMRSQAMGR